MDLFLNVALLLLGFLGSIIAIGGDTWRQGPEFFVRRVLPRGWVAISCLVATLAIGVAKEMIADRKQELAEQREATQKVEAIEREKAAAAREEQLGADRVRALAALEDAKQKLRETQKQLGATSSKLDQTNRQLLAVEPTLLSAMTALTSGITRESDFAFVSLDRRPRVQPKSSKTQLDLKLYGGDQVEFLVLEGTAGPPADNDTPGLSLIAGGRNYPIKGKDVRMRVSGPIGEPMPAFIDNPARADYAVKITVYSTDSARFTSEFSEIFEAIRKAKAKMDENAP